MKKERKRKKQKNQSSKDARPPCEEKSQNPLYNHYQPHQFPSNGKEQILQGVRSTGAPQPFVRVELRRLIRIIVLKFEFPCTFCPTNEDGKFKANSIKYWVLARETKGSLSNHEDDGNKNPTNLHI